MRILFNRCKRKNPDITTIIPGSEISGEIERLLSSKCVQKTFYRLHWQYQTNALQPIFTLAVC